MITPTPFVGRMKNFESSPSIAQGGTERLCLGIYEKVAICDATLHYAILPT
jgi:hypothetical protein